MAFVTGSAFLGRRANGCRNVDEKRGMAKVTMSNSVPDNEEGSEEPLSRQRKFLEKSFGLTLEPTGADGKSGECDCIFCQGSGKRKCSWCKGQGTRQEMLDLSWEEMTRLFNEMKASGKGKEMLPQKVPVVCSACKGTTMLRCGFCQGAGKGSYGFAH